ncbi:MAG: DUF6318 family protein [Aeromicrobium sp.]
MRVIVFLMATALLCVGCTEDKPREPDPTTKPSPTATVPSMPNEAEANTVDGAIAFVEHYVDVFNYASNTGDVTELQRLSDPKCEGCTEYIDLFEGTYAAGGFYRDSDWMISNFEVRTEGKYSLVLADLNAPAGIYKSSAADNIHKGHPEKTRLALLPVRSSNGWTISSFQSQGDQS